MSLNQELDVYKSLQPTTRLASRSQKQIKQNVMLVMEVLNSEKDESTQHNRFKIRKKQREDAHPLSLFRSSCVPLVKTGASWWKCKLLLL